MLLNFRSSLIMSSFFLAFSSFSFSFLRFLVDGLELFPQRPFNLVYFDSFVVFVHDAIEFNQFLVEIVNWVY